MIKENKELLLRDLCARLQYGVKCKVWYNDKTLNIKCTGIDFYTNTVNLDIPEDDNAKVYIDNIKPYLFPLSSMTEEQREEIEDKLIFPSNSNGGWIEILYNNKYEIPFWFVDFCNKNHLDHRGLIPMGLAIDATNKNIY